MFMKEEIQRWARPGEAMPNDDLFFFCYEKKNKQKQTLERHRHDSHSFCRVKTRDARTRGRKCRICYDTLLCLDVCGLQSMQRKTT